MNSAAVKWSFMWFVPWMSSVFIVPAWTWAVWQSTQRLVRGTQTYLCSVWSEKKRIICLAFHVPCAEYIMCVNVVEPRLFSAERSHTPLDPKLLHGLCVPTDVKKRAMPINFTFKRQVLSYGTAAYLGETIVFWDTFSRSLTAGEPACSDTSALKRIIYYATLWLIICCNRLLLFIFNII